MTTITQCVEKYPKAASILTLASVKSHIKKDCKAVNEI